MPCIAPPAGDGGLRPPAGIPTFLPMATPHFDFSHLTPGERIRLAEELWDSLPSESEEPPLNDAQRRELDRRLEAYRRNPNAGSSWEEVRKRIVSERKPDE
jgi:putative addiction module component (TIGR02574 family)